MSTIEENYIKELNDAILEYGSDEKKNDDDILAIQSNTYVPARIIRRIVSDYVYNHFSVELIFDAISSTLTAVYDFSDPLPKIKRDNTIPEAQFIREFEMRNQLKRR